MDLFHIKHIYTERRIMSKKASNPLPPEESNKPNPPPGPPQKRPQPKPRLSETTRIKLPAAPRKHNFNPLKTSVSNDPPKPQQSTRQYEWEGGFLSSEAWKDIRDDIIEEAPGKTTVNVRESSENIPAQTSEVIDSPPGELFEEGITKGGMLTQEQWKFLRKESIVKDAEEKIANLEDSAQYQSLTDAPELNPRAVSLPQDNVAECKRLLQNFQKYVNEKTQEDSKSKVVQSVNQNAYEIRLKILQEAISIVKFNAQLINSDKDADIKDKFITAEDIEYVANRFYSFVENKR